MYVEATKPQEYFVYFKVLATKTGTKFAVRCVRGFVQRFLKDDFMFGAVDAHPDWDDEAVAENMDFD